LTPREDPRAVLDATAAAAKLRQRGLGPDVVFAAREDVLDVVPAWRAGRCGFPPSAVEGLVKSPLDPEAVRTGRRLPSRRHAGMRLQE